MNEYDSNRIFDLTKKINYIPTKNLIEADCYILNTCHIREKATEKVHHDIGRVKKEFRNISKPIVLVTGCVAQAEGNLLLKKEKYIDAVIGPQSYHQINDIILKLEKKSKPINITEFDVIEKFDSLNSLKNTDNKISSFLTVQEGCDKFCHFCVVPYTRGPEYSRPFNQIINEAKELIKNGTKEIILLGQNVNAYNDSKYRLSDLLLEFEKMPEILRIRYTTSHPKDMTDDLIDVYKKSKKLMPLVHLPIQSGSDRILNLMNRKHTINDYLEVYKKLKEINPNIHFSSDFIIAYPGEEESDFQDTVELIKKIKFINSYSFIFSPRLGTIASKLKMIDKKISQKRLEIVQKKIFKNQINYNKSLENKIVNVLVENRMKDNINFFGRTEYMTSVVFDGNEEIIGKIVQVKIFSSNQNTLFGKIHNYSQKVA